MAGDSKQEKYMAEKKTQRLIKKLVIFKWTEIEEVFKRKFLNRQQGIDIYTHEKKVLTFNLILPEKTKEFMKEVKDYKGKNEYSFKLIDNPVE